MFKSPLRYPGGKNKLAAFIAKICVDNNINGHYVEPYAGGASVALFLLLEGYVKKITINDKDRAIYAFWHSVLYDHKKLCTLIRETDITVENWEKQKAIQQKKDTENLLKLGFSTLFLNRTNRSGILNGGIIGGKEQDGAYKIFCRFNKEEIISRIEKIAERSNDIRIFREDAISLIDIIEKESSDNNVIFYFDPPYYLKGSSLYLNHYKYEDHKDVSDKIKKIKNIRWIVSYDNVPEIKKLYSGSNKKEYSFSHTAYTTREGKEILFFSDNIIRPKEKKWNPIFFKQVKKKKENQLVYKER